MDCLAAQQLVSDALDHLDADADELAAAKAHCRECTTCAAFVRAMLAVERAGAPQPPEGLVERVMAAVRAEVALTQEASVSADVATAAVTEPAETFEPAAPARSWSDLVARARDPRNRRAVATWAAAAAVVLLAAGVGAVTGMRAILVPPRSPQVEMGYVGSAEQDSALSSDRSAAAPEALEESGASASLPSTAPDLITVGSTVYRFAAVDASTDPDGLEVVGSTRSTLDGTGVADELEVLGSADPARVWILDDQRLLAFQRLTRSYDGRLYVLQSAPIGSFGEWPSLPSGIREPSSADGSPDFEEIGNDASGTAVYEASGVPVEKGIAVGPAAVPPDPIAGAPGWTWWESSP